MIPVSAQRLRARLVQKGPVAIRRDAVLTGSRKLKDDLGARP